MIDYSLRNGLENVICSNLNRPQPQLFDDGKHVKKCTAIGKGDGHSILLCGKRQSYFPFHCIVGPDWPVVVMVYCLILAANLIVLPIVAPLGLPVVIIGVTGFLSLLYCYSAVACSDPGIVYEEALVVTNQSTDISTVGITGLSPSNNSNNNINNSGAEQQEQGEEGEEGKIEDRARDIESLMRKEANTNEEASTEDALVVQGTVINTNNSTNSSSSTGTGTGEESKTAVKGGGVHSQQRSRQLAYSDRIECGQCELQRPYTARHCHYCGVCIDELDHHCPCKCMFVFIFILVIIITRDTFINDVAELNVYI